jgi:hypothetical protein
MAKRKWILSVAGLGAMAAIKASLALASADYVAVDTAIYLKLVDLNTMSAQSVTLKPPTVKGQIRYVPSTGECALSVFESGKRLFERQYERTYRVRDCSLNNDALFFADSVTFSMRGEDLVDLASAITAKGASYNSADLTQAASQIATAAAATVRAGDETVISTVDNGEGSDRTRVSLTGSGRASRGLVLEFDLGGVHEISHPTR